MCVHTAAIVNRKRKLNTCYIFNYSSYDQEWPGSVMRPAIQRSNSYGGYRYTPVDTSVAEDSEGERTEGSTERSTGSRPTTRRSVSDSGMASNEYNLAPFDDIVDDKQVEPKGENCCEKLDQKSKPCKLSIAVLVFALSLGLHIYSLKNFFTESDNKTLNTPNFVNSPDSLVGNDTESIGQFECLLAINYTTFRKEVIDTSKNCTLRHYTQISEDELSQTFDRDQGLLVLVSCLCTKQMEESILDKFSCSLCCKENNCSKANHFAPQCQNNGTLEKTPEQHNLMLTSNEYCGKCRCKQGFTGNFCQLPKKLKCIECDVNACDKLPFCNGTSIYPCQDLYDSRVMNCTKKDDKDSVQDCLPLNSMITNKFTEKPTKNVETHTPKPHVKGSDKYSVSNITEETPATCSRTSAIGYFVIDWIVFGGIIFLFVYVFMRCKGNLLTLPRLKIYTFCGLILIVIPPIVNCVTCCSGTCDTVAKLLPFIKCACLAITTVLLYKEISQQIENHASN
ncbi:uncharacterized protein LOC111119659 isoform X2 [Crassostrea virginica]